jgi:predicted signal transduction protein with EAL and GGDEF domain
MEKLPLWGASIGIALAPGDAADGEALHKMADIALYTAKATGRNGFRFFDHADPPDALAALPDGDGLESLALSI